MDSVQSPPFLRISPDLRQRIYTYLLCLDSENEITTINYDLAWPYLQNPTSTTFTYHQLDMCSCPGPASQGSTGKHGDHIYTRYVCEGPEVQIVPKNKPLWVLQQPNGPLNILRPATKKELDRRPSANIVRANKLIYREATPLLYRGRKFRFLTGHCPRGRYQAYATQTLLSRMSTFTQEQITDLSLIYQQHEEDCRWQDVKKAYVSLARFILSNLPHCRTLHILKCASGDGLGPFCKLFRREDMRILVRKHDANEEVECFEKEQFVRCIIINKGLVQYRGAARNEDALEDSLDEGLGELNW
ncbi:hypothetical protein K469DRAFT_66085 [Zopfia rhizophila CBS 207.26]|uniref:Uncharacterized protein n=1 Tax=Zopfia rhizophila CBS 207.26 TaxID=1314779 RepID=A0A6A6D7Y3_9PEZI|nr:hypothetical protein K469DRAFT_66085 [Zopfia rhizophila CBS 207.26]